MKDTHHRDRHLPDAAGNGDWQAEVIDQAKGQAEKLKELVSSLVSLSRMDEEESPLQMRPFAISEAAEETADSFRDYAEAACHPLELSI